MKDPNYIYGKRIGKIMLGISQRTLMESSLLSMSFMILGLIVMTIYICFFTGITTIFKILTGINAIAGVIFMSSYLTTLFQQYKSYMSVMELQ